MTTPKYPNVKVELVGQDGNAFFIIGRVRGALKSARVPSAEIDEFVNDAMSGDYDHVLQTCMKWVDCFGGATDEDDDPWETDDQYDDYEGCDHCGDHVANGEGRYFEGDRLCDHCYESEMECI